MAATIRIHEVQVGDGLLARGTAATGVENTAWANKTTGTIRFKSAGGAADDLSVNANNPIAIPAAGVNRSFTKCLVFYMEADDGNSMSNTRFYTDGTNGWTGVSLYAGRRVPTWAAAPGVAGTLATTYLGPVGTDSAVATVNAFTYTAAAPLDLSVAGGGGEAGPWDVAYDNMHFGDLLYLQMDVGTTASAGTLAGETLTFSYDEV